MSSRVWFCFLCFYFSVLVDVDGVVFRFREGIEGRVLNELGISAGELLNEFTGLINSLDGKSLIHLVVPRSVIGRLTAMMHALVEGWHDLARAHALMGLVESSTKLQAIPGTLQHVLRQG